MSSSLAALPGDDDVAHEQAPGHEQREGALAEMLQRIRRPGPRLEVERHHREPVAGLAVLSGIQDIGDLFVEVEQRRRPQLPGDALRARNSHA